MQITVKSSRVGKTGKNEKGEWALIIVVDENTGIEYTTFDKKAHIGPGAVLDIGEPDVKEGKHSFKKCTVVSESTSPPPDNGKDGMTPELWAEKDRAQAHSIETQTAFKGVMELAGSEDFSKVKNDKFVKVYDAALDWAMSHFKPSITVKSSTLPKQEKSPDEEFDSLGRPTFKYIGEFLTRVTKEKGITRDEICVRLSINDVKEITDFSKAWADLTQKG